MLFNSYIFILAFLPLSFIGYFAINKIGKYQLANIYLISMSFWFYGYFNPSYLSILCGSITINWLIARLLNREGFKDNTRKIIMTVGICLNIGVIFYFKYFDFFIENINVIFQRSFELRHILLPLGISFFTFQQISFLVDSYRGETKEYDFIEYALFVSFFPPLIAGPIVLHKELIPFFRDVKRRKINSGNVAHGIYIFALGLFKKVIIADTFGKAVNWGFGNIYEMTSMEILLVSFSYTFQLYFDFSGYCDMAIGISRIFNIELPNNFNSPYKATSIIDFWGRWHMSLTRFLRKYIYFPLGGSRKGKVRTYLNIMLVFLASGIWHGANWTFILWGLVHGMANCLNRIGKRTWDKLGTVTQWFLTFMFINLAWIIFRAPNIDQTFTLIKKLVRLDVLSIGEEMTQCFNLTELIFLETHFKVFGILASKIYGFNMWLFLAGAFFAVLNLKNSSEIRFKPTIKRALVTIVFLSWSIMSLAGISTFLYFNF